MNKIYAILYTYTDFDSSESNLDTIYFLSLDKAQKYLLEQGYNKTDSPYLFSNTKHDHYLDISESKAEIYMLEGE